MIVGMVKLLDRSPPPPVKPPCMISLGEKGINTDQIRRMRSSKKQKDAGRGRIMNFHCNYVSLRMVINVYLITVLLIRGSSSRMLFLLLYLLQEHNILLYCNRVGVFARVARTYSYG